MIFRKVRRDVVEIEIDKKNITFVLLTLRSYYLYTSYTLYIERYIYF